MKTFSKKKRVMKFVLPCAWFQKLIFNTASKNNTNFFFYQFLNSYFPIWFWMKINFFTTHTCLETATQNWCHNCPNTVNNINTKTSDDDDHGQCGPKKRFLERERERKRERVSDCVSVFVREILCLCVCVCVWERERLRGWE